MGRGRPIRRATAVAATASGGDTMAPSANANANGIGSNHHATKATPTAVKSTRPTDSPRIGVSSARRSMREELSAAA